jgi:predicted phosphohydrolase
MKIQLKSDMHHEFSRRHSQGIQEAFRADMAVYNPRYINPEAEVLVLAGDIINAVDIQIAELKEWVTSLPIPVVYVTGNHEYYGSNIDKANKKIEEAFKDTNVHFLNNDWVIIDNVVFVGGTLWTKLTDPWAQMVHKDWSDFFRIEKFTISQWQILNDKCTKSIENVLKLDQFKDLKKVVVTHHTPSYKSCPSNFVGDHYNPFFHNSLEELMLDYSPNLWVHGHTHDSFNYEIGGTRVVCNPYGYFPKMVNHDYKRGLILEI